MTIPKDNTQLENARRLRREMTPHEPLSEKMKHSNTTVSSSKLQFAELIKGAFLYTFRCTVRASLVPPFERGGRHDEYKYTWSE